MMVKSWRIFPVKKSAIFRTIGPKYSNQVTRQTHGRPPGRRVMRSVHEAARDIVRKIRETDT